jgi:hypothetical protein
VQINGALDHLILILVQNLQDWFQLSRGNLDFGLLGPAFAPYHYALAEK